MCYQRQIQDFLKGGSYPSRGGSFSTLYLIFPHEIEIIWGSRGGQVRGGGQVNPPKSPLNLPLVTLKTAFNSLIQISENTPVLYMVFPKV